ncbi:HAMP domain-containing sensor histidine kinase [Streptomyces flavalbus]|uniref:histidine kinase n=1 Tax=Streptomyces flavalbus TaxID=2665155 RepID=A0ABW2WFC1_9ACTN
MSDGPSGRRGSGGPPWVRVRPFSIRTKLGVLVVIAVLITTGLSVNAVRFQTEVRFIMVFSMIATLLVTQFVAQSLIAPLDEMNAVARSISHGDYTRRVRENRWDELGDLAVTINRMADELEAQDRQRKELVANVSHELRTPIAGLRAVLENVVDGIAEADPETMRTALKQTERLGRLVETLLDLSRLDDGVVPLRQRRFEVWPYLSGVLKEANMVASARAGIASGSGSHTRTDVHLRLDVFPPDLTAHADPERIHQVVANLIDNAVKHSPPHGRVTVKARAGDRPGSLELEVLDEGPGIPRSEWHRVFERFNRGAVNRPHGPGGDGGTGLGLAIARWAVDLHGGRIRVAESERGARILVTLPGLPSVPS